jgi:hypothetical protein
VGTIVVLAVKNTVVVAVGILAQEEVAVTVIVCPITELNWSARKSCGATVVTVPSAGGDSIAITVTAFVRRDVAVVVLAVTDLEIARKIQGVGIVAVCAAND